LNWLGSWQFVFEQGLFAVKVLTHSAKAAFLAGMVWATHVSIVTEI
jgi:hypothetical protein